MLLNDKAWGRLGEKTVSDRIERIRAMENGEVSHGRWVVVVVDDEKGFC